jgi:hypothetical protein
LATSAAVAAASYDALAGVYDWLVPEARSA